MSYNNNQGEVRVVLPEVFPLDRPVHMLEWIMPADKNTSEAEGPSSAGQNTSEANPPPGSSAATTTVNYAGIFMSLFAWLVMMLGATM